MDNWSLTSAWLPSFYTRKKTREWIVQILFVCGRSTVVTLCQEKLYVIFTARPKGWAANNPIHANERWQRWCVMDVLLIFNCLDLVIVAQRLKAWIIYVYSKKKPTSHYFHCKVEAALPTSIQSQVLKITQSDLAGAAGALYSWSTPRKLG